MTRNYNRYPELEGLPEKERMNHYYRDYRNRNPERMLYRAAKDRSLKRGLEFNLDITDIVIPKVCPILGIDIVIQAGNGIRGGKPNSPSLDRIDNSRGYTKDNIQVISNLANSMKFTANPEQLKRFAEWINKTYD